MHEPYKHYRAEEKKRYTSGGLEAPRDAHRSDPKTWNRKPDDVRQLVVELSLDHPELTPRELSVLLLEESEIFVSESSFYHILRQRELLERTAYNFVYVANEFHHKAQFANEMWWTVKINGWGWYYFSTVIDDYSRYISIGSYVQA